MYDEKAKARNIRSLQKNFEQVRLTVKKGTLAKYKAFAEKQGMSMTAFITALMDAEMSKDAEFCAMWAAKEEIDRMLEEAEKAETVARVRSEMKPSTKTAGR